jgi:hypothetical protein
MCPKRHWFTTYEPISGGLVFMRNDAACKIVGIDTIRIKMHDKNVRTLTNVRHIPYLKKILFFFWDSLDYDYSGEGGANRVCNGSLVEMKGNKVDGLYFP